MTGNKILLVSSLQLTRRVRHRVTSAYSARQSAEDKRKCDSIEHLAAI